MREGFIEERISAAVHDGGHGGIVAGVRVDRQSYVAGAGRTGGHSPGSRPSGSTIFRIASLTKPFTGAALAAAAARGDLALEDSAASHLPPWFGLPDGIRLEHLATHRSGLPRGTGGTPAPSVRELADAVSLLTPWSVGSRSPS